MRPFQKAICFAVFDPQLTRESRDLYCITYNWRRRKKLKLIPKRTGRYRIFFYLKKIKKITKCKIRWYKF